jgi:hypothetical protein
MRCTVLAILLATLPLSTGLAAEEGNRVPKVKAFQTERAIRAEATSCVLTTEICRGCVLSREGLREGQHSKLSGRNIRRGAWIDDICIYPALAAHHESGSSGPSTGPTDGSAATNAAVSTANAI